MIAIVDYGMGNLRSVEKALQYVGMETIITNEKRHLQDASGIIVPGVGAFYDAMYNLRSQGLDEIIIQEAEKGKAILGICLGMQLFYDKGYEGGESRGLSLLKGDIIKLPAGEKLPHMGWNRLKRQGEGRLLEGIKEGAYVYFIHSYYARPENYKDVRATTAYGLEVPAVVERENIFGMQFHPEKSSDVGLQLLENFRRVIKC